MRPYKKKLRPGLDGKASVFTRFLQPQQHGHYKDHRSNVVLVGSETRKQNSRNVNGFLCTIEGSDEVFWVAHNRIKMIQNGPEEGFFVPLTEEEKEAERQAITSAQFKEPRKKWKNSQAKRELYGMILDGTSRRLESINLPRRRQEPNFLPRGSSARR